MRGMWSGSAYDTHISRARTAECVSVAYTAFLQVRITTSDGRIFAFDNNSQLPPVDGGSVTLESRDMTVTLVFSPCGVPVSMSPLASLMDSEPPFDQPDVQVPYTTNVVPTQSPAIFCIPFFGVSRRRAHPVFQVRNVFETFESCWRKKLRHIEFERRRQNIQVC
jgi:hypothetical protein